MPSILKMPVKNFYIIHYSKIRYKVISVILLIYTVKERVALPYLESCGFKYVC